MNTMKQIFTIMLLLMAIAPSSQAQITINASDVPPLGIFNIYKKSVGTFANPSKGNNQSWDYSAITPDSVDIIEYLPETDNFWTSMGVGYSYEGVKPLNSGYGYFIQTKIEQSATGVVGKGFHIPPQDYDISAVTGNTGDSLRIPSQNFVFASPIVYMPFPQTATYNNWQTNRMVVDFTINAPLFGMNNTPCQQVFYEVRKDSVLGWGTMRVYTPSGPSGYHNVLMQKKHRYFVDSFYVGGAPASATLQSVFGISQGQRLSENNAIEFLRKGSFIYLQRLWYGDDSTNSNIETIFSDKDNVTPVGINNIDTKQYSTILYPNPATNCDMKFMIMGGDISNMTSFSIVDLSGRIITSQKANWNANNLTLPTRMLSPGTYILQVNNNENHKIITETFQIK